MDSFLTLSNIALGAIYGFSVPEILVLVAPILPAVMPLALYSLYSSANLYTELTVD